MPFLTQQQVLDRRADVEKDVIALLEELQLDLTLDNIKEMIYNEEDWYKDFEKLASIFDNYPEYFRYGSVGQILSDAWSNYPHRNLYDLSPEEYYNTRHCDMDLREAFFRDFKWTN